MKIKFLLIVEAGKLSENICFGFLEKCMSGILGFSKYDFKEPLKKQIEIEKLNEVKELFDNYENIIFKGKNKSWMTVKSYKEGIGRLSGSIEINNNISNKISELLTILESFENNQIIFGKICEESEFDMKHKVVTEWSYGWEGTSRFDFMKFLPGIYWYTIFGKELVDSIGKNNFVDLPNVIYTNTKNGCVSFHLNEPIDSEELEQRVQLERQIANMIGDKYFFDKTKDINTLGHHPKFIDFLKSLSK